MSQSSFIPAASLRSNLTLISDGLLMSQSPRTPASTSRPHTKLLISAGRSPDGSVCPRSQRSSPNVGHLRSAGTCSFPRCHPVVPLGPFHVHSGRFEPDTGRLHASLSWRDVLSDRDKRSSLGLLEAPAALGALLFLSPMCQIPQKRFPLSPVRQSQLQRACLTSSDGSLKVCEQSEMVNA